MPTPSTALGAIRKRAARRWLSVHQTDDWQYGPYYVVDAATNGIIASGIGDLEALAAHVDDEPIQTFGVDRF